MDNNNKYSNIYNSQTLEIFTTAKHSKFLQFYNTYADGGYLQHFLKERVLLLVAPRSVYDNNLKVLFFELLYALRSDHHGVNLRVTAYVFSYKVFCKIKSLKKKIKKIKNK